MNDRDFEKLREEEEADTYEDAKKVLDEEFEFTKNHFFEYLLVFGLGIGVIFIIVSIFLNIMSWIYN